MGRYLDSLKNSEKVAGGDPKKPNKPPEGSSLGFLGTPPPRFEINQAPETTRTATQAEAEELRQLVAAIYQDDTEADRTEALNAALADPSDALICYRAIALERDISIRKGGEGVS
jgi:hypothetical protein